MRTDLLVLLGLLALAFASMPVFAVTAGHFGDKYFTGIGAVWAAIVNNDPETASAIAYTCLTCGRCRQQCPVEIDVPEMIIELRKLLAENDDALKED